MSWPISEKRNRKKTPSVVFYIDEVNTLLLLSEWGNIKNYAKTLVKPPLDQLNLAL